MKIKLLLLSVLLILFIQQACKTTKKDVKLSHSYLKTVEIDDFDTSQLGKNFDIKTRQHLIGTWQMLINDDGTYRVIKDNRYLISGDYTIKENTISLTDMGGSAACLGDNMLIGEYSIILGKNKVTFTPIHDDCSNRKFIISGKPWEVQE